MQREVSGIVYERNICQHPGPEKASGACKAIVHDGASLEKAMAILRG
jgi:DhnA family fructose-bisphosphate aldolase class Ia